MTGNFEKKKNKKNPLKTAVRNFYVYPVLKSQWIKIILLYIDVFLRENNTWKQIILSNEICSVIFIVGLWNILVSLLKIYQ